MSASHAAIVLAAGGSVRLGRAKQLLRRDGEALVHRASRLACESGASRVMLVMGARHAEISDACRDLPIETCINAAWSDGLASSLHCAARALHAHAGPVLVLGCDQPALGPDHLRALLDGASHAASACAATRYGARRGSPAVLSNAVFAQVGALHGDRGFGALLDGLDDVWMLDAPELACDLDTEHDVQAAIARGWLDAD